VVYCQFGLCQEEGYIKGVGLFEKRGENVNEISVIMVVVFLIAGCAPSWSAWVSSKDGW